MDNAPITTVSDAETTPKIGRTSTRGPHIEVITRGEPRRTWTPEQKREIVAESLGPALTPTQVARKYGISTGQLYTWRQQVLSTQTTLLARAAPDFAQVETIPVSLPPVACDEKLRPPGLIEIVLPSGVVVRVDATVDTTGLSRVLAALNRR
jgi:transposase